MIPESLKFNPPAPVATTEPSDAKKFALNALSRAIGLGELYTIAPPAPEPAPAETPPDPAPPRRRKRRSWPSSPRSGEVGYGQARSGLRRSYARARRRAERGRPAQGRPRRRHQGKGRPPRGPGAG